MENEIRAEVIGRELFPDAKEYKKELTRATPHVHTNGYIWLVDK